MGVTPHRKGNTLPETNDTTSQPEPQDRIQWIYASESVGQLEERYDQWAADYDADLLNEFGWLAPQQAADAFSRYVPRSARVLDAGAGTGLVGESLKRLGYSNIEALDLSTGMLEEARKKNAYSAFHQMTLGETLDFPTGAFDATICVGVLTLGHAPASSLYEMARVTRPGGHVVFTLRPRRLRKQRLPRSPGRARRNRQMGPRRSHRTPSLPPQRRTRCPLPGLGLSSGE